MNKGADRLLLMGTVGRPSGIRGDVTMNWQGDYIPAVGDVVFLGRQDDVLRPFTVLAAHSRKRLVLTLAGVDGRTAAEALTGAGVYMDRDTLPALEADACYLADLVGSAVYLPDGTLVGRLDHFEFPAGQPVWSIKDAQRREILFPALPRFIKALKPESKEAVIDPPPGLLDIYHA